MKFAAKELVPLSDVVHGIYIPPNYPVRLLPLRGRMEPTTCPTGDSCNVNDVLQQMSGKEALKIFRTPKKDRDLMWSKFQRARKECAMPHRSPAKTKDINPIPHSSPAVEAPNTRKIHLDNPYYTLVFSDRVWTELGRNIGAGQMTEIINRHDIFYTVEGKYILLKGDIFSYQTKSSLHPRTAFHAFRGLCKNLHRITEANVFGVSCDSCRPASKHALQKDCSSARISRPCSECFPAPLQAMVRKLRKINTHKIVRSLAGASKEKQSNKAGQDTGIFGGSVLGSPAVARILWRICVQVFGSCLKSKNRSHLHAQINTYVKKHDVWRTSLAFHGYSVKATDELARWVPGSLHPRARIKVASGWMHSLISFVFSRYIPTLIHMHFRACGGRNEAPKYVHRAEYIRTKDQQVREYLKEHMVEIYARDSVSRPGEAEDSVLCPRISTGISTRWPYSIRSFPKPGAFRHVFKMPANHPRRHLFAAACRILTQEVKAGARTRLPLNHSLLTLEDGMRKLAAFRASHADRLRGGAPVYALKLDYSNCFDSIPIRELLDQNIPDKIFSYREYTVDTWNDLLHEGSIRGITEVHIADLYALNRPLPKFSVLRAHKYSETFVESELVRAVRGELECTIVHHKGKLYARRKGITQGFCLSSHICAFYLAAFDHIFFPSSDEVLVLRYVDDTLVLSLSPGYLQEALRRVEVHGPPLGIHLSKEKCIVVQGGGKCPPSLPPNLRFHYHGSSGGSGAQNIIEAVRAPCCHPWVRWCGIVIDMGRLCPVYDRTPCVPSAPRMSPAEVLAYMLKYIKLKGSAAYFAGDNPHGRHNAARFLVSVSDLLGLMMGPHVPKQDREKYLRIVQKCARQRITRGREKTADVT